MLERISTYLISSSKDSIRGFFDKSSSLAGSSSRDLFSVESSAALEILIILQAEHIFALLNRLLTTYSGLCSTSMTIGTVVWLSSFSSSKQSNNSSTSPMLLNFKAIFVMFFRFSLRDLNTPWKIAKTQTLKI